ncbi:MAG TPA: pantetheine-phosphate adenylyltransferase [Patescibacteria group bacterium]|nr:pantetheine-phosphate adenylyltransferase [Patescibacteria group bacterium]
MKYKHSVLGGTFDHLHIGHKHFIKAALEHSESLTIGLTVEELYKNKAFAYSILSYEAREKELKEFLREEGFLDKTKIVPIKDFYGITLDQENIDAIFVTRHGEKAARLINKKRHGKGFRKLSVNLVNFARGNDGNVISSTRIRAGLIDRNGFSYKKFLNKNFTLKDSLRETVKFIPEGKIYEDYKVVLREKVIISVGDVVSSDLVELGRQADLSIVDKKTKRIKNTAFKKQPDKIVRNPKGTLKRSASEAIFECLRDGKKVIKVIGEEDLLALSATLLAPLGSIVVYGMPDKGLVEVVVTEEKKKEVLAFFKSW